MSSAPEEDGCTIRMCRRSSANILGISPMHGLHTRSISAIAGRDIGMSINCPSLVYCDVPTKATEIGRGFRSRPARTTSLPEKTDFGEKLSHSWMPVGPSEFEANPRSVLDAQFRRDHSKFSITRQHLEADDPSEGISQLIWRGEQ